MTREEAIEAIKCNWPDSRYTILREALYMAISALQQQECFGEVTKKVEPLTNAQKIRAMTDEELAAFINRIVICHHLRNAGNCEKCPIHPAKPCDTEGIAEWLQQPAEEDDHE